jgi:hypothetical protein
MEITFYGVLGSTPVCGFQTMKYGGNTSCVHIIGGDTRIEITGLEE